LSTILSPSIRQHVSYDDYLEAERGIIRTVLCCIVWHSCELSYAHWCSK